MFCATPLRSAVKETVYSTVVDTTVAKTVYSTVVDVTVAKTVYSTVVDATVAKTAYSTVETVQHSMALMGHGKKHTKKRRHDNSNHCTIFFIRNQMK